MSRKFKFRVWDSQQKKLWYVGERNGFEYYNVSLDICQSWEVSRARMCYGHSRNTGDVLMQWTGLKDKNGCDIYEGDILEVDFPTWNLHGVRVVARWDAPSFVFDNQVENWTEELKGYIQSRYKVIGNIYENPDLIKS